MTKQLTYFRRDGSAVVMTVPGSVIVSPDHKGFGDYMAYDGDAADRPLIGHFRLAPGESLIVSPEPIAPPPGPFKRLARRLGL